MKITKDNLEYFLAVFFDAKINIPGYKIEEIDGHFVLNPEAATSEEDEKEGFDAKLIAQEVLNNFVQNESNTIFENLAKVNDKYLGALLIANPSLVSKTDSAGNTLLHQFCHDENLSKLLIKSGADLFAVNFGGYTPLATEDMHNSYKDYAREVGRAYFGAFYPAGDEQDRQERLDFIRTLDHTDAFGRRLSLEADNKFIDDAGNEVKLEDWEIGFLVKTAADKAAKNDLEFYEPNEFIQSVKFGASTKGLMSVARSDDQKSLLRIHGVDEKIQPKSDKAEQFRELARLVKNAYLAGKLNDEINGIIDQFGKDNGFDTKDLGAKDMIAFMEDLSLKQDDGTTDLKKKFKKGGDIFLSNDQLEGEENPDEAELRRQFYDQLLQVSLDEDNSFTSDNVDQKGKEVLAQYLSGDARDQNHVLNYYFRSKIASFKQENGIEKADTYTDLVDVVRYQLESEKTLPARLESDLKKIESKSVELIERYRKIFDKKFDLAAAKSGNDDIYKRLISEFGDYKKLDPSADQNSFFSNYFETFRQNELLELREKVDSGKKAAEDLQKKINELKSKKSQKIEEKLVDVLFAGSKSNEAKILKTCVEAEVDLNPSFIHKVNSENKISAATNIQRAFRGFKSRSKISDLSTFAQSAEDVVRYNGFNLEESPEIEFKISPETQISNKEFSSSYAKSCVEEVKGEKIYHGSTGLVVHEFSGFGGLNKLTNQYEEASRRKVARSDQTEVSIALIRDYPVASGTKDFFCIVTNDSDTSTKNFINESEFGKIAQRSEELYEYNLDYVTTRDGISAAIAYLNNARNSLMNGVVGPKLRNQASTSDSDEKVEAAVYSGLTKSEILRDTYAELENGLRKSLVGTEIKDTDSHEEIERKKDLLMKRSQENFKILSDPKFFAELEGDFESINSLENHREQLAKFLDGKHSTNEQRSEARTITSRTINKEIADRTKLSTKNNQYKFGIDGLEMATIVAEFQKENQSTLSKLDFMDVSGSKKSTKKDLEQLLSVEMPHSPYRGISISRPKGYSEGHGTNSIACVTFNGDKGDDTAWISLKGGYYIRVSRCDENSNKEVYRDGKLVNEAHKKGDVLIDTGVVFRKKADGTHEAVDLKALDKSVQDTYKDMRIKAMTIDNEGQRNSIGVLIGGKSSTFDLEPKVSLHQEQSRENFDNAKIEGIVDQSLVFRCNKDGDIIDTDEKKAVSYRGAEFDLVLSVKPAELDSDPISVTDIHLEIDNAISDKDKRLQIDFMSPEIRYKKGATIKSEKLFDESGYLEEDAKKLLVEMIKADALDEFLDKSFTKSEVNKVKLSTDLDEVDAFAEKVALKMRRYSNQSRIGIRIEEVDSKGFKLVKDEHGAEIQQPVYAPTGKKEEKFFVSDVELSPDGSLMKASATILESSRELSANAARSLSNTNFRS